jgi:hypothetical protein
MTTTYSRSEVMKKIVAFFAVALVAMILAGCASSAVWYRQDGLVPFQHFQTVKNEGERLVFISPVLAPNHRQSGLYIITNPEDTLNALDALGDPGVLPPRDLDKILRPFSPVMIQASRDLSTVNTVSNYDISNQDGMASFSLPPFVDRFFYAYVVIKQNYRWGSNDPVEVWTGIMSLPPGSQDVYIAFSEEEGDMAVFGNISPDAVKNAYDTTTGLYGMLLGKKDQVGFIKIGFKERVAIANEQSKARALAAGATYSVYSKYYTYQQGTRQVRVIVGGSVSNEGSLEGGGTSGSPGTPGRIETRTEVVNVRILHELEFELYKGDVRVFQGTTPMEITGIEVGPEYTLRWVSPVDGNRSIRFTMGLNFRGYPGHGWYYIE